MQTVHAPYSQFGWADKKNPRGHWLGWLPWPVHVISVSCCAASIVADIWNSVLGSFASVAHERLDIQHCMLVSLKEQFDWSIEFESIVYAAGETAHHSLVFSRKLFELVVHIATCSDYPKLVKSIAVKRLCPILGKHTSLERQAWMLLKQFPWTCVL